MAKYWDKSSGKVKRSHPNAAKLNNFLAKKLIEVNDLFFESKIDLTPKQAKQKLEGAGGSKSFFVIATERIRGKYDRGTYSVAKSELSIPYNLEEFLSCNFFKKKYTIIEGIKTRRKMRVSKGRTGEHTSLDSIEYLKEKMF